MALTSTVSIVGPVQLDTPVGPLVDFTGSEFDDLIFGTPGDDSLAGLDGNDTLYGDFGNDVLDGGAGNDSLDGGVGIDTLLGGLGDDQLVDSAGSDLMDGGDGNDVLIAQLNSAFDPATTDVTLQGGAGNDLLVALDLGNFTGSQSGIARARLAGGDGDDVLLATGVLQAELSGGTGRDVFVITGQQWLTQLGGTRVFFNPDGSSVAVDPAPLLITDFQAGAGGDVLELTSLLITLGADPEGANPFAPGGPLSLVQVGADVELLGTDITGTHRVAVLQGVNLAELQARNLLPPHAPDGSAPVDQLLAGSDLADSLAGGLGNDTLLGLGGNDLLLGGGGADSLDGGDGNDSLDGGSGVDTLIGGLGDDTLDGAQGGGLLDGGGGNDLLRSSRGAASLIGGDGDDNLQATGLDVAGALQQLDGGAGNDSLDVRQSSQALLDGGDGSDLLAATGVRASSLAGGAGDDVLQVAIDSSTSLATDGLATLAKTAVLDGGDGNDRLVATAYTQANLGQVSIELLGGAGDDALTLNDNIAGHFVGSAFYGMAHARLDGGEGNDTLSAGGVVDLTLSGGAGSDRFVITAQQWITQRDGARTYTDEAGQVSAVVDTGPTVITDFQAGAGGDVLDLADLLAGLGVALDGSNPLAPGGVLQLVQQGGDLLLNVQGRTVVMLQGVNLAGLLAENLHPPVAPDGSEPAGVLVSGSEFNDFLVGSAGTDTLDGLAGDDYLDGGSSADLLLGGDGNDTLLGNGGSDSLLGGPGNDILDGGLGNDSLAGGDGDDQLLDSSGSNQLDGGAGNDFLGTGGLGETGAVSTLSGGAGADLLFAQALSGVTLDGGDDNDDLRATGNRSASLSGGTGDDQLTVNFFGLDSGNTDGELRLGESALLDGGSGADTLNLTASTFGAWGRSDVSLLGGEGDDSLSVRDNNAGNGFFFAAETGISSAVLDGGAGDDRLSASGVLQLTLTGGSGRDTFVLTAQQWRTQGEGLRHVSNPDGSITELAPGPTLVTDFQTGADGDVLDIGELLLAIGYVQDGSNPFSAGGPLQLAQVEAGTELRLNGSTVALLQGVNAAELVNGNLQPPFAPDGTPPAGVLLTGSEFSDFMLGTQGADTLIGLGGNDWQEGGASADLLDGGADQDSLFGGLGDDTLLGGAGNDFLSDGLGRNLLDGGDGDDQLFSSAFGVIGTQSQLLGGAGQDNLNVTYNAVATLDGGEGNDAVTTSLVRDAVLAGGAGDDTLSASIDAFFSAVTDANEALAERAVLDGGDGNDFVFANATTSTFGGQTRVSASGGAGNDVLIVTDNQAGNPSFGNPGIAAATLDGGDGNDNLYAGGVLQLTMTGGAGLDVFTLTGQQLQIVRTGAREFVNADGTTSRVEAGPTVITDFQAGAGGDVLDLQSLMFSLGITDEGQNPFAPGGPFNLVQTDGGVTLGVFDPATQGYTVLAVLQGVLLADLVTTNLVPGYAPDGSPPAGQLITGSDFSEVLNGGLGADTILGLGGNDIIEGRTGNDLLDGGDDQDNLSGQQGNDSLAGGAGFDFLDGGAGDDLLDGQDDGDQLQGGAGNDTLLGGLGNDFLSDNEGSNLLDGSDGDDVLSVSGSGSQGLSSQLLGGAGQDNLSANYIAAATLDGGEGVDFLSTFYVRNAVLAGGAGNDVLSTGIDAVNSNYSGGDSRLDESAVLDGGDGDDQLQVNAWTYTIHGQTRVSLAGGAGDDLLSVSDNQAGSGFSSVNGIAAAVLDGGAGDDRLVAGGVLQLTLTGGAGRDTFVLTQQQWRTVQEGTRQFVNLDDTTTLVDAGPTVITDFQPGAGGDRLDIQQLVAAAGITDEAQNPFAPGGPMTLVQTDVGVAVGLFGTTVALLQGVLLGDLTTANLVPPHAPDGSPPAGVLITGSEFADALTGGLGGDTIQGLGGDDVLDGRSGDDLLDGGAGQDTLGGGQGGDSLIGGAGFDVLSGDGGNDLIDGQDDSDQLQGGAGDDTLLGGLGNDTLNDGDGHNLLDGGDGDDVLGSSNFGVFDVQSQLLGGAGQDNLFASVISAAALDGGEGHDQLATGSVRSSTLAGGAGNDTLSASIDGFSSLFSDGNMQLDESAVLDGGEGDDLLSVNASTNTFSYGQTRVSLAGGSGNDVLSVGDNAAGSGFGSSSGIASAALDGGDGDDTLRAGGVLQLSLTGGAGSDTFVLAQQQWRTVQEGTRQFISADGTISLVDAGPAVITDFQAGVGGDRLDLQQLIQLTGITDEAQNPFAPGGPMTLVQTDAGVAVALLGTTVALLQGVLLGDLTSANLVPPYAPDGSPPAGEVITGSDLGDQLTGGLGGDTLQGLGGDDVIDGRSGGDVLDGGDGQDTLFGAAGNDSLSGGAGVDTLDGGAGDDLLDGNDDADLLIGGSGNDTLLGGGGNDFLVDNDGIDLLDGGTGDDQLSAGNLGVQGAQARLLGGSGDDRLSASYISTAALDGGEGLDTMLTGNVRAATLTGGAGNDTLGASIDAFYSLFSDGLAALEESATLDGGDGDDQLSVSASTYTFYGQTRVSLAGGAGNDTLTTTDAQAGFGFAGFAGIAAAALDGGGGDDTLRAGGVLQLSLTGGAGSDTFVLTAQQWRTQLEGTRQFSNIDGTTSLVDAGPAVITDFQTGALGDRLDLRELLGAIGYVDDGSNPFAPGGPLAFVQTGAGAALSLNGTTVALLQGVQLADLATDNLVPPFTPDGSPPAGLLITGSEDADTLVGGRGSDTLLGLGGNDFLDGGLGHDLIEGGDGIDLVVGGLGHDSVDGGLDNDTVEGGDGNDLVSGGDGDDFLTGGGGNDRLAGGAGNDLLDDGSGSNVLDSGDGNDTLRAEGFFLSPGGSTQLWGGAGQDFLSALYQASAVLAGEADDDLLFALGVDEATLDGGDGNDTLTAHIDAAISLTTRSDLSAGETARLNGGAGDDRLVATASTSNSGGQVSALLDGGAGDDLLDVHDLSAGTGRPGSRDAGIARAVLDGGDGNDELRAGGVLQLIMTGGAGSDTFVLSRQQLQTQVEGARFFYSGNFGELPTVVDAGPAVITDFQAGAGGDRLDLSDLLDAVGYVDEGGNPYGAGGPIALVQTEAGVVVRVTPVGVVTSTDLALLQGVRLADLVADNVAPPAAPDGSEPPGLLLTGSDGADSLDGGGGADTLAGLGGDDLLTGGTGADLLDGGAGNDTLDGGLGFDTLIGGEGDDALTDTQGSNRLDGGAGDDLLSAAGARRGATQTLDGGDGNDLLFATDTALALLVGGQGDDVLKTSGAWESLMAGDDGADALTALIDGAASAASRGDRRSAEFARLDGGAGDDELLVEHTGSVDDGRTDVQLLGGDGNDSLTVRDLVAGSGFGYFGGIAGAVLDGGAGDDWLQAGGVLGLTMIGGAGRDTFVLTTQQLRTQQEGARFFSTEAGSSVLVFANPTAIADFQAGPGGDLLDLSDLLAGLGVDADSDNPFGPTGPLLLSQDGAAVVLSLRSTGMALARLDNVDLATLGADNLQPPWAPDGSAPAGIVLAGSDADDSLTGSAGHDQLDGLGGNDSLAGRGGDDLLQGGDGDDQLGGGGGADTLLGGAGNDVLDDQRGSAVLDGGAGDDLLTGAGNQAGADALLQGGDGNDLLRASAYREAVIDGGAGNDQFLLAGLRHASVSGGEGDDNVSLALDAEASFLSDGNPGLDESAWIDAGAGDDLVQVVARGTSNGSTTTVTLLGGAGNDVLSAVDDTAGTGQGLFSPGISQARLNGGEGDDRLRAGGVLDLALTGGTGSDTFVLTAQQWRNQLEGGRFVFDPQLGFFTLVTPGPVVITDFQAGAGGDVLEFDELLDASGYIDTGANPLAAGGALQLAQAGNDVELSLNGLVVARLQGVALAELTADNLGAGYPADGSAPIGQLISGSAADDFLAGTRGGDTISGLGGDDLIDGGRAADLIDGGAGNDIVFGGSAGDTLLGGEGDDQLDGGQGSNLLDGGDGDDTLFVNAGLDADQLLQGGAGNDQLQADVNHVVTLDGGEGDDALVAQADVAASLVGGAGDDRLTAGLYAWAGTFSPSPAPAGAASAALDGGEGNDVLGVHGVDTWVGWGRPQSALLAGGAGDDVLEVRDDVAGRGFVTADYGIALARLDGGDGDDRLVAGGVLDLALHGGAGRDTFVLTTQQWQTQAEHFQGDAGPARIDDFLAGAGGDVLDVNELLGAVGFPLADLNPFDPARALLSLQQQGADVVLVFDPNGYLGLGASPVTVAVLANVDAASLVAANFGPAYAPDGTPPNHAPVTQDQTLVLQEDQAHVFGLADFAFSDADATDSLQAVTLRLLPGQGTLLLDGQAVAAGQVVAAAAIAAGALVYTPAADANGAAYASIGYSVSDGAAESAPAVLTLDVAAVNDAPLLAGRLADLQASAGSPFAADLPAGLFTDVDGDVLGLSAALADGSALPGWLVFDATTGHFSGTPGAGDAGTLAIVVTATDAAGANASDSFVLAVAGGVQAVTGTARADRLTGSAGDDILDGRGGNDTLSGLGGDDTLLGGAGNDRLQGGAGQDSLAGGQGSDTLTGGAGDDLFVFDTPAGGRGSSVDRITDFRSGADQLVFDDAVFTAFAGLHQLDAGMWRAGAGVNRARDADDHLLYDTSSGKLYYDADGVGGSAAVQVAELGSNVRLTVNDVLIG